MTVTASEYITRVIASMPRATPLRPQIERELGSLIAERVERGQPLDDVLRQLGDPVALADSYLAEVPLVPASFWRRGGAKALDLAAIACVVVPFAALMGWAAGEPMVALAVGILSFGLGFGAYNVFTEWYFGETLGKHLLGLCVVRESGARISFGQAIVRQLPQWLEVFWIDILFAPFTDRKQRAFELLSKTRVVRTGSQGGTL
jgi:uncharacterized RDD family membrane protein YckC